MASKPFASGHLLAAADVNDLTGVIDRSPTAVDVVSTTAESALYLVTVAAGAMSTDRMLRMTIGGDILQNATATPTILVYFGGIWVWRTVLGAPLGGSNDADRRPWRMVVELQNINSASVQHMNGTFWLGDPSAAATGQGTQFSGGGATLMTFGGTGAINSAIAQNFQVNVSWDLSSANASWRKLQAVLELL